MNSDVQIDNLERITIIGITEGTIASFGSTILNVFDTPVKFFIMPDDLKVPDDGILGGDYFYQEQVTISYHHKSIVTISRLIDPIPFLNPKNFFDENKNFNQEHPVKS